MSSVTGNASTHFLLLLGRSSHAKWREARTFLEPSIQF